MKKYKTLLIFLSFIFLLFPFHVTADENIDNKEVIGISNGNTIIRTCPLANDDTCPSIKEDDNTNALIFNKDEFVILDTVDSLSPDDDRCQSKKWYKLSYKEQDGFVCSSYITIKEEIEDDPTPSYTNSISSKYKVTGYATDKEEGRVAIVSLNEGATDDFNCNKIKILVNYKLYCRSMDDLKNIETVNVLDTNNIVYDFEKELLNFPESYRSYLREIHNVHPTWRFYAYKTGLDFNEVVRTEKNSSLIDSYVTNESYFDTYEGINYNWRDNRYSYYEANRWVRPSYETTAYYIDPRSYLGINDLGIDGFDYKNIFVFEDGRAYKYQMDSSVNQMLTYAGINTSFPISNGSKTYKEAFVDGATFSKISPLNLIARSRAETGKFTSGSVRGDYVNPDTGISYAGYYNYFNVGAYGAYPVTNGLIYAKNVGWNDRYKAIVEGSIFIGTKYVYNGQETQYFQKFNVSPNTLTGIYGHQYQTNIEAPIVEAGYVFWGYKDSGNINNPIVFHIPTYENMPDVPSPKPHNGNPNNWLLDIKIDGTSLTNFNGDNYYSYDNNWDNKPDNIFETNIYTYKLAWNKGEVTIDAIKANNLSTVEGAGTIKVTEDKVIDIKVVAQNGTSKIYKINIIKEDAPLLDASGNPLYPEINDVLGGLAVKYNDKYMSGLELGTTYQTLEEKTLKVNNLVKISFEKNSNNKHNYLATGDKVKITSGNIEQEFTYILFGDLNGDGEINLADLVNSRNILLGVSNLSGANKEAADINKNGKIELSDLIDIRNNILGLRNSLQ